MTQDTTQHNYGFACPCGFAQNGYSTRTQAIGGANRHAMLNGCRNSPAWPYAVTFSKDGVFEGETEEDVPF